MFAVVQLASSNTESLPAIINYTVPFVFLSCQAETEDLTKEIQKLQWQLQDKEDVIKENQLLKQQLQEKALHLVTFLMFFITCLRHFF